MDKQDKKIEQGLKKVKFYDRCFFGAYCFLIIFFLSLIPSTEGISFVSYLALVFTAICLVIVNIGMVYHIFKRKSWSWLVIYIIFVFFSLNLISLLFYLIVMRSEFKKGNGVYQNG